jgi:hypothetical protein
MKAHILVSVLAVLLASPALAQQPTPEQVIAFLDKDADGQCSLQEYLQFQLPKLTQFDANADGALQLPEFRNSLEGKAKNNAKYSFDMFDKEEKSRALTQREFLGYHAFVFKTYVDRDNDGFMSPAEWSSLMGAR